MNSTKQLGKHFREVYFGGNWTTVNLKDVLRDVDHELARAKVENLNSIATLVYHIHYYVKPIHRVLQGQALEASDRYSFDAPNLDSENAWREFQDQIFEEAEQLILQIEGLNDAQLFEDFSDGKYGSVFRNLLGIIEHTHYHLGQISLIKKMLQRP